MGGDTEKHEWCGEHRRRHEIACSQSGQASVSLSSCEAEVMAASEGIKEALLLQEVLMFVGFWDTMKLKSKWTAARHMHSSIDEVLDA